MNSLDHEEESPNGVDRISRREFLLSAGASGITAAALSLADAADAQSRKSREATTTHDHLKPLTLTLNGKKVNLRVDNRATLLDAIRETAALTGTKKGCDHGQCGACTVHVNGRRINSCLSLAIMHDEDQVTTIEGLGDPDHLHPVQEAFLTHDAFQCGYCTPGQMMSAAALLREPCGLLDVDVKELMSGNICRCGAYANIVSAIQSLRRLG